MSEGKATAHSQKILNTLSTESQHTLIRFSAHSQNILHTLSKDFQHTDKFQFRHRSLLSLLNLWVSEYLIIESQARRVNLQFKFPVLEKILKKSLIGFKKINWVAPLVADPPC